MSESWNFPTIISDEKMTDEAVALHFFQEIGRDDYEGIEAAMKAVYETVSKYREGAAKIISRMIENSSHLKMYRHIID